MNKENSTITLSSGVVLNIKSVPPLVLSRVYSTLPDEPKPPKFMNKDLGREEENPSDPGYIAEVEQYQLKLSDAVSNAIIVLGTSLKSVPAGFPHPYNDFAEWSEPLEMLDMHIDPPKSEHDFSVYNAWVKYVAAVSQEDISNLIEAVSRLSGVTEKEVAQAAEQFRGDEGQPANIGV